MYFFLFFFIYFPFFLIFHFLHRGRSSISVPSWAESRFSTQRQTRFPSNRVRVLADLRMMQCPTEGGTGFARHGFGAVYATRPTHSD